MKTKDKIKKHEKKGRYKAGVYDYKKWCLYIKILVFNDFDGIEAAVSFSCNKACPLNPVDEVI